MPNNVQVTSPAKGTRTHAGGAIASGPRALILFHLGHVAFLVLRSHLIVRSLVNRIHCLQKPEVNLLEVYWARCARVLQEGGRDLPLGADDLADFPKGDAWVFLEDVLPDLV